MNFNQALKICQKEFGMTVDVWASPENFNIRETMCVPGFGGAVKSFFPSQTELIVRVQSELDKRKTP